MKVLLVGPDPAYSKGGMASVIQTIRDDEVLSREFEIDVYGSCIRGNVFKRILFSIYAYIRFVFTKRYYDVYHLHVASKGSMMRKSFYLYAAKRWGKPVIFHIHAGYFIEFYHRMPEYIKRMIVKTLKMADQVIALSEGWKSAFESEFHLSNCIVLRNCVNMSQYEEAICDAESHLNAFASIGLLGTAKGTYDFIDAVAEVKKTVPDITVYLAGNGEIEQAKEIIKQKNLGTNIKVLGWVDSAQRIELLKKISVLVLPSYHEGLPMAILEAMACGKGIISTNVGAIPEVVGEENGILIQPGDIQALIEAMVECATNIERVRHMSACNIEKIRREYSMERMRNELRELYTSLAR